MKQYLRKLYYFFMRQVLRIKHHDIILEYGSKAPLGTVFEGRNKLAHHSFFSGELGFASYVGANSVVTGKIGRFCSIAEKVTFLTKTHPVQEYVSTHPAFYSLKKQSGFTYVDKQAFDEEPALNGSKYSIEVGNDVYIGYGVTVIGPCRIGDGAVIAAGAVVTGDIPAYTIVGGVPAKIIRKRFTDAEIDFLKQLEWWSKPQEWLKEHAKSFGSVDQLKKALEKS